MVNVVNIVGSGTLPIEIDLENLAGDIDHLSAEYDPNKHPGMYLRFGEEEPLITVYRTGKYIISGCSSFEELYETNDAFLQTLTERDIIDLSIETDFTVQNVVCTGELGLSVNLNTLSISLGLEKVEYEPEQFPGLIYRPVEFPAVMLVFANGNVVITGAADVEGAEGAFSHLQKQVEEVTMG